MSITQQSFGSFIDPETGLMRPVLQYTLSTSGNFNVKVISYGASISSIEMPDKNSITKDVILGFDDIEGYLKDERSIGRTIGRYGNRINKGHFILYGEEFQVNINNNDNHLHGGKNGWSKRLWDSTLLGDKVIFSLLSPDGDQGYPGTVLAQVSYYLSEERCLHIDYQAISNKPTIINMTNHAYFNLAGHDSGQKGLLEHGFTIKADRYLPVTNNLIPTGILEPVSGTPFDLREGKQLKKILDEIPMKGLDNCFCIQNKVRGTLEHAAKFFHPPSGRKLDVYTTEPGVQIYTSDFLPKMKMVIVGRGQTSYEYQGAFCCEPQNFPDAINHGNFPICILNPGEVYKHSIIYKLTTET